MPLPSWDDPKGIFEAVDGVLWPSALFRDDGGRDSIHDFGAVEERTEHVNIC